jgi:hypothetical protein
MGDRDDRRVEYVHPPSDHRLEAQDDLGRDRDQVRAGAVSGVPAPAADEDPPVSLAASIAPAEEHRPARIAGADMDRERIARGRAAGGRIGELRRS